ncbi:hypothetical protein ACSQ67_023698 [Phaseolus vulgaris]
MRLCGSGEQCFCVVVTVEQTTHKRHDGSLVATSEPLRSHLRHRQCHHDSSPAAEGRHWEVHSAASNTSAAAPVQFGGYEEGKLERPKWAGETPLSRLVQALISFKPLYSVLKLGARRVFISTAEKNNIPWRQMAKEVLESEVYREMDSIQNQSLVYPDYYLNPFHAYEEGNLTWLTSEVPIVNFGSYNMMTILNLIWLVLEALLFEGPISDENVGEFHHLSHYAFHGKTRQIPLQIQEHTINVYTFLLPVADAEVILGASWLAKLGPHAVDYSDLTIKLYDGPNFITLCGKQNIGVDALSRAAAEAEAATMSMVRRALPNASSLEEATQILRGNWLHAIEQHHIQYSESSVVNDILDIGCSVGISTKYLADKFPTAKVTGLDLSPYFLAVAQHKEKRAMPRKIPVRWIHANGEDTGLPSKSFDLVSLAFVLHECPTRVILNLVREAFRLLRPGGTLALTDFSLKSKVLQELSPVLFTLIKSTEPFLDEYYLTDMDETLREAGFVNITSILTDPKHVTITATVPQ